MEQHNEDKKAIHYNIEFKLTNNADFEEMHTTTEIMEEADHNKALQAARNWVIDNRPNEELVIEIISILKDAK